MGGGCSGRACFSETAELIEWFTAGIFKHQYDTVPVASEPDGSGRARRIKLFLKGIRVLQSFQTFRPGILRHRRKHQNLRGIVLTSPAIKDKLFILPQRFEDISR
jgi:hypothetical protein